MKYIKSSKTKLSLLVAAHEAQKTLPRLVEDLLHQGDSGYNIEIVISKDCNTDYESILPADDRIVFSESGFKSGPSVARTRALNASTGTHFILMDSDDSVSDNYIQSIFEGLKENRAIAVRAKYYEGEECVKSYTDKTIDLESYLNFYGSIQPVMPRSWMLAYPDVVAEDGLALINAIQRNGGFLKVVDGTYNVMLHQESFCSVFGSKFSDEYRKALSNSSEISRELGNPSLKNDVEQMYMSRLIMSENYDNYLSGGGDLSYHAFADICALKKAEPVEKAKIKMIGLSI